MEIAEAYRASFATRAPSLTTMGSRIMGNSPFFIRARLGEDCGEKTYRRFLQWAWNIICDGTVSLPARTHGMLRLELATRGLIDSSFLQQCCIFNAGHEMPQCARDCKQIPEASA